MVPPPTSQACFSAVVSASTSDQAYRGARCSVACSRSPSGEVAQQLACLTDALGDAHAFG
jgi:hypothetical protein